MKKYLLLIALLFSPIFAYAGDVQIVSTAMVHQSQGEYFVTVTLRHDDTGWEHYADEWRVVDADGNTLGSRVLMHPHVNEQPFARGLNNVKIDPTLDKIYIEAHDKLHGWSPQKLEIDLTKMQNGKLIVKNQ